MWSPYRDLAPFFIFFVRYCLQDFWMMRLALILSFVVIVSIEIVVKFWRMSPVDSSSIEGSRSLSVVRLSFCNDWRWEMTRWAKLGYEEWSAVIGLFKRWLILPGWTKMFDWWEARLQSTDLLIALFLAFFELDFRLECFDRFGVYFGFIFDIKTSSLGRISSCIPLLEVGFPMSPSTN